MGDSGSQGAQRKAGELVSQRQRGLGGGEQRWLQSGLWVLSVLGTVPSWTWWKGCFSRNFPASSGLYLMAPVIGISDISAGPGLGTSVLAARLPLGRAQAGGSSESELGVCRPWLHASLTVVSRCFSFLILHKCC